MLVWIKFDATLAVDNHDGAVGVRIGWPVVAWDTAAAEIMPASLYLVADPQRRPPIGPSGQQRAESGAIDVENSK